MLKSCIGVCLGLTLLLITPAYTPDTPSTLSIQEVSCEMYQLNSSLDTALAQLRETLVLLALKRLEPFTVMVTSTRASTKVVDGYSIQDVVLALDEAYSLYNLDRLGMSEKQWFAQVFVESRFDCNAKSYANARGLCQLLPSTERWLNQKYLHIPNLEANDYQALYDPKISAQFGALYMSLLLQDYRSVGVALEVYNKGPAGVHKTDYQILVSRAHNKYFERR